MKVYIVYTSDYHHCDETIIKGFTDLERAVELAVDVVMKNNRKYNRDYVKEIICSNYKQPLIHDLFVYTNYCDMDYDKFVGIMTVDVD